MRLSTDVLPDVLSCVARQDLDTVEITSRKMSFVVSNFMTTDCIRLLSHAHWNTEKAVAVETDREEILREVQLSGPARDTVQFLAGAIASSSIKVFSFEDLTLTPEITDLLLPVLKTVSVQELNFDYVDFVQLGTERFQVWASARTFVNCAFSNSSYASRTSRC